MRSWSAGTGNRGTGLAALALGLSIALLMPSAPETDPARSSPSQAASSRIITTGSPSQSSTAAQDAAALSDRMHNLKELLFFVEGK